jgi:hypothetical protein
MTDTVAMAGDDGESPRQASPRGGNRSHASVKRILYVQYTNPVGYPPLEHSSRILADAGLQILPGHACQGPVCRFSPARKRFACARPQSSEL